MATNTGGTSVKDYLEGVGRGLRLGPCRYQFGSPHHGRHWQRGHEKPGSFVVFPPVQEEPSSRWHDATSRADRPATDCLCFADDHCAFGNGRDYAIDRKLHFAKGTAHPPGAGGRGSAACAAALVAAVENGTSRPAREAMSHAALLSGMALANSGLGMAHGVAAALGVHLRVSHGLACAVMLPIALEANRGCLRISTGRVSRGGGPGERHVNSLRDRRAPGDDRRNQLPHRCAAASSRFGRPSAAHS